MYICDEEYREWCNNIDKEWGDFTKKWRENHPLGIKKVITIEVVAKNKKDISLFKEGLEDFIKDTNDRDIKANIKEIK